MPVLSFDYIVKEGSERTRRNSVMGKVNVVSYKPQAGQRRIPVAASPMAGGRATFRPGSFSGDKKADEHAV
jgi:hypothetical protein